MTFWDPKHTALLHWELHWTCISPTQKPPIYLCCSFLGRSHGDWYIAAPTLEFFKPSSALFMLFHIVHSMSISWFILIIFSPMPSLSMWITSLFPSDYSLMHVFPVHSHTYCSYPLDGGKLNLSIEWTSYCFLLYLAYNFKLIIAIERVSASLIMLSSENSKVENCPWLLSLRSSFIPLHSVHFIKWK